ncbi:hypothetical protein EDB89DRAFT_2242911 [Lactarius sanguifluus]|nr:hypothetical protein EDB89DRAFT_2242911 [Lactarius sanguifluus]
MPSSLPLCLARPTTGQSSATLTSLGRENSLLSSTTTILRELYSCSAFPTSPSYGNRSVTTPSSARDRRATDTIPLNTATASSQPRRNSARSTRQASTSMCQQRQCAAPTRAAGGTATFADVIVLGRKRHQAVVHKSLDEVEVFAREHTVMRKGGPVVRVHVVELVEAREVAEEFVPVSKSLREKVEIVKEGNAREDRPTVAGAQDADNLAPPGCASRALKLTMVEIGEKGSGASSDRTVNPDNEFSSSCIAVAQQEYTGSPATVSPTTIAVGDFDLTKSKDVPEAGYPGAFIDFYGFPSNPISVYRTGDTWPVPKGPQARRVPREPRPICNHPIQAVWHTVGVQVYKFLDSIEVKWSTIDPVRFAEKGGEAGPLYLWVGVDPRSLSLKGAKAAAVGCKRILADAQFPNVEIAFRESIFARSIGPQLLDHTFSIDPTADLRSPFTPALGVQIAPLATPHFEGTGALYLRESSQSKRVFLLTARHVPLPLSAHLNKFYAYEDTSQPRHEVLILGSKAYQDALEAMTGKIERELILADYYKMELAALGEAVEGENTMVARTRQVFEGKLTEAEMTITAVDEFHDKITNHWSTSVPAPRDSQRIGLLIDLYLDKIDWDGFKGNVIYLGNKISTDDFVLKMHPHPEGRSSFKFPKGGLLQVKGVVKENEIRQPTQLDANGEECLLVIKNGKSTGVTIGRGTGMESFIREYDEHGNKSTSMEVAIYSYSHKDGAFSASGDSGSIVVDGLGRIVGLLTGGTGAIDFTDVTYLTPYFWLEERIKQAFPDSYLYPIKV